MPKGTIQSVDDSYLSRSQKKRKSKQKKEEELIDQEISGSIDKKNYTSNNPRVNLFYYFQAIEDLKPSIKVTQDETLIADLQKIIGKQLG